MLSIRLLRRCHKKLSPLGHIAGSDSTSSHGAKFRTIVNIKSNFKALVANKEINTIPNMITFARILASPGLAYAIAHNMKAVALTTCVLFGFTDWLDGYLARKLNQKTVFGALLDPVADKIMIGSICGGLAYNGLIPLSLAGLIVGRDVALLACSFIIRARERPPGSPFFDTTYSATFSIIPSDLSKINTAVQFFLLSVTLSQFACEVPSTAVIEPLWWVTATTTIYSGLGYLDGSGIKRLSKPGVGRGLNIE